MKIPEAQRLELLSLQYFHWNDLDRAERAAREALRLTPDAITPAMIMGEIAFRRHDDEAGIKIFEGITRRDPANPIAHDWLAYGLGQLLKLDEALHHSNKAVSFAPPSMKQIHAFRSLFLLKMGKWEEGFQETWEREASEANVQHPIPIWRGESLRDKNLAFVCGVGLGDAVNFVRYLKLVRKDGGKIICLCRPTLIRLLQSVSEIDDFIRLVLGGELFGLPENSVSIPAELMLHIFKTTPETIPADVPYLHADPALVQKWAPKFSGENRLRVGLVWSGAKRQDHLWEMLQNEKRNLTLAALAPLFEVPGVAFYSLQTDIESGAGRQAKDLPPGTLIDWTDELLDLADTAALVRCLDLVISVDTAVAHLAGALGKPVWMLNRFAGDWRWGNEGERTPWYPTMRIFRQPRPGDWASVIQSVKEELHNLAVTKQQSSAPIMLNGSLNS